MGLSLSTRNLTLTSSIGENIFLGNERAKCGVIDWEKTHSGCDQILKRVGLKENPNILIKDLGVGKQQLVEIAKALAKDVQLLILDEPTAALNEEDADNLLKSLPGVEKEPDYLHSDLP